MNKARPEHVAPAYIFYGDDEAKKYTMNTRIMNIQTDMTERALQILAIPEGKKSLILDIGCGSGISGQVLEEHGHDWVGVDIAPSMLDIAAEREVNGDLIKWDMGHGLPFKPGSFDAAVSISAIQWLCCAENNKQNPYKRMKRFFQDLYSVLVKGGRCAFQFYPETPEQIENLTNAAMKNGFTGGLIVDYPNSKKAKKYFLFLMAGYSEEIVNDAKKAIYLPKALGEDYNSDEEEKQVSVFKSEKRNHKKRTQWDRKGISYVDWVKNKKERQRRQGRSVRPDSKYTARKRKDRF
jgi:18S rRNA (guanine1575-N7)-methyltransferase